jgi:hypothetical protein
MQLGHFQLVVFRLRLVDSSNPRMRLMSVKPTD